MSKLVMKKETVDSKSSLYFSPKATHSKYGRLFQKRSVYMQFLLFMSGEYTFLSFGRGVENPTTALMPLLQAQCADI